MNIQDKMKYHDEVRKEFLKRLEVKTSWGRNDLRTLLMECETEVNRRIIIEMYEELEAAKKENSMNEAAAQVAMGTINGDSQ